MYQDSRGRRVRVHGIAIPDERERDDYQIGVDGMNGFKGFVDKLDIASDKRLRHSYALRVGIDDRDSCFWQQLLEKNRCPRKHAAANNLHGSHVPQLREKLAQGTFVSGQQKPLEHRRS